MRRPGSVVNAFKIAYLIGPQLCFKAVFCDFNFFIGPSEVRALPVAAGTNVVATIVGIIFSFSLLFSEALTFLP